MPFEPHIRPEVKAFAPYEPGRSIESVRRTYGLTRVVKLASNENPLGASPRAQRAVRTHADGIFRYPAAGNPDLVAALAAYHGVDAERIMVGNGSDEIIDLLLRVLVEPATAHGPRDVAAFRPCFGMYPTQTALCGLAMRRAPLNPDFSFPWQALRAKISDQTALVFVTTPDNPSGFCPLVEELAAFARSLPPSCLLVVDEAYMDFCDNESAHSLLSRLDEFENVAVLRTFSKSRGLAGLRLGYAILPLQIADYMRRAQMPFTVNVLAEAAGIAALEDDAFYHETLRVVREGRSSLMQGLCALGCVPSPSQANFIMFALPPACSYDVPAVNEALLARGVIIRPLGSYGLPRHMRVTVGLPEENTLFLHTLEHVIHA